jgi:hypothetical protein
VVAAVTLLRRAVILASRFIVVGDEFADERTLANDVRRDNEAEVAVRLCPDT